MIANWRTVRVFISSTFRDMHAERDYLVKFTFPQLRKICESRGVTWGEVDLRWGITDEQKAEGKVLPICLAEIERCRPFFIGLLGECYGWLPQEIPQDLIAQQPWLTEHRNKSVTELEIIHGVLKNPSMANRACFYFRDPAYVDKVPAGQKADFIEPDSQARQKLMKLKDRIRSSGLAIRENYPDPQTLGRLVLEDLTAAINQEFPTETVPDPLDREAAEHETFAQSRAGVYIGRQEYFEQLDKHIASDGSSLVILGESGCGKSALLANWALRYRQSHPDEFILMHFIGASAYSADWAAMLRRIMGEFKRRFGIQQNIPDKPDQLRLAFANWLHMAAAKGKAILILDALNQLEDRDGAPDLVWLPPVIPPNIRLIISTLPGRPLDELEKRNWPTLQVKQLDTNERRELIAEYLGQYRKTLNKNQLERIVTRSQMANPLYLRALLEELRLFGAHEKLDERIDYYLAAQTIPQLYEKILERYEQDYQCDRPNLVKDAMSLIWAARRGLSEVELLEMLGKDGQPLPRAYWSPFYLAAEQSLVNRSGLIGFFHEYLREAIGQKYLPTEKQRQAIRLQLADYFERYDISPRKIDEFPWQLAQAKSWQQLYNLLADLPFLQSAWDIAQFEVMAYWAQIEANSSLHVVDAYAQVLKTPDRYTKYVWHVSMLLDEEGYLQQAQHIREYLVEYYRQKNDRDNFQASLGNLAMSFYSSNNLDQAMRLYKEQEQICQELRNKEGLRTCLTNQALILTRNAPDKAMELLKKVESLSRELMNKDGLRACLCNQALILSVEDPDRAMKLLKEAERLSQEIGNKDGLRACFTLQADIVRNYDPNGALNLLDKAEQICRDIGSKHGLWPCLSTKASIFYELGHLDKAMNRYEKAEHLCRQLGNKQDLAACLDAQAVICRDRCDLDRAMELYHQTEQIWQELGKKDSVAACLGRQALILRDKKKLEEAMRLRKRQEQLYRELEDEKDLMFCLMDQAIILKESKEFTCAMGLFKKVESICNKLQEKNGLQKCLFWQASIYHDQRKFDEAMALLKQQEQICRDIDNKRDLSACLGGQGKVEYACGNLDAAMNRFKDQENIYRQLKMKNELAVSLCAQAAILQARNKLEQALELFKAAEQIYKEIGNKGYLADNLKKQAAIFYKRGDKESVRRLYKEQETIHRELGNKKELEFCLQVQLMLLGDGIKDIVTGH